MYLSFYDLGIISLRVYSAAAAGTMVILRELLLKKTVVTIQLQLIFIVTCSCISVKSTSASWAGFLYRLIKHGAYHQRYKTEDDCRQHLAVIGCSDHVNVKAVYKIDENSYRRVIEYRAQQTAAKDPA